MSKTNKILVLGLILIVLIGLFSPILKVQAQNFREEVPLGVCYKASELVGTGVTETFCKTARTASPPGLGGDFWNRNMPPPPPTPEDAKGTCYKASVEIGSNVTNSYCKAQPPAGLGGDAWGANPSAPTPAPKADPNTSYHLLEPIPDPLNKGTPLTDFPVGQVGALGKYLTLAIKLIIGLCAVAAVVMIVIGGIEWSASELISGKEDAKQRIWNAILGLILALFAWLLLYTINPDLLNTEVDIGGSTITSEGELTIAELKERIISVGGPINSKNAGSVGTVCDARSIFSAAGGSLTAKEAEIFACILYYENRKCQNIKNYKWQQGIAGYSAFGIYQINLNGNWRAFENQTCYNILGISGPLRCDRGFTGGAPNNSTYFQNCITAATNFNCQTAAATYLLKHRSPPFADWTVGGKGEPHTNQLNCTK